MRVTSRAGLAFVAASAVFGLAACAGDTTGTTGNTGAEQKLKGTVVTYNTPKEWANYGEVLQAFTQATGVTAPNDPKNSGQTLAALQAEKGAPASDVAYYGITFGIKAKDAGVTEAYRPKRW